MTCRCGITFKIHRSNKLIAISCNKVVFNPRKSKMSNFCGTRICAFITAKLSSDLTVKIRRTWGDSDMKVPCGITGSSNQDFDFEVSCKNTDPKGETSNWLVDSLQKQQHEDNFLFLNFRLWAHILRSKIDQLKYSQNMLFVETLCKWWRRVTLQRHCILCPYNPLL